MSTVWTRWNLVNPRVTKNHIVKSVRFLRERPAEATLQAIPDRPLVQHCGLKAKELSILVFENLSRQVWLAQYVHIQWRNPNGVSGRFSGWE
jgi:hypothetical protein